MSFFRILLLCSVFSSSAALAAPPADMPTVKRGDDGICYCPGADHYGTLADFSPYPSINACLAEGGREPRVGQGVCVSSLSDHPVRRPNLISRIFHLRRAGLDDAPFQVRADVDGDCLDAHSELLEEFSTVPVALSDDGCKVMRGRWVDPYTGRTHTNPSVLEVGHLVSLKYAHEHGAASWEEEKRQEFANDPTNIFAMAITTNRQKGDSGPLEWLPESKDKQCHYVLNFTRLSEKYGLKLSRHEANDIGNLLGQVCN
jgi:hypothetical protein